MTSDRSTSSSRVRAAYSARASAGISSIIASWSLERTTSDEEDRIIELPATWMCRVKVMPPEVRAVHHISMSECAGWDAFDPAVMFNRSNPASAIAAHNAEFETKFFASPVPVICTYKAALRVWPHAPSHSNGALRYWLEDAGKIAPRQRR